MDGKWSVSRYVGLENANRESESEKPKEGRKCLFGKPQAEFWKANK